MKFVVNWNQENCDVYIGRPSKFGNPFPIGVYGTREEVLELYEFWLYDRPELIVAVCKELKSKILGCSCHPRPCHGDLLARIANGWQLCLPLVESQGDQD